MECTGEARFAVQVLANSNTTNPAGSGSGFALAKAGNCRLLEQKKKRMPIIARNRILLMNPSAVFLNHKVTADQFDGLFYTVQVVELVVGLVQLKLMGMNFHDGLRLAGRLRPQPSRTLAQSPTGK